MLVHKAEYFDVGDTWQIEGRLSYADGTPFDLSPGCQIQWAIQDSTGTTVLGLTLNSGITVLDPNGICLITVLPSQSATLPVGNYIDQLRAVDPGGLVSTQFQGPINATKSFFT